MYHLRSKYLATPNFNINTLKFEQADFAIKKYTLQMQMALHLQTVGTLIRQLP